MELCIKHYILLFFWNFENTFNSFQLTNSLQSINKRLQLFVMTETETVIVVQALYVSTRTN